MKIAILQPEVPHYRREFFDLLQGECETTDLYVYNTLESARRSGFEVADYGLRYMPNRQWRGLVLYNPLPLLRGDYDVLVLMLHFGHITTWLLLLTKLLHRKKIILWGQGISVKRYLKEERKPDWKLRWQMALADGVWLYMEKEYEQWRRIFPTKNMVALNNTLTGVDQMVEYSGDKAALKSKYGIDEETVFIFCARFESAYRRTDLLVEAMKRLDTHRFGFIIIGDGKNKPDFSGFKNVHDFGAIYDTEIKRELFTAADIYFQPGWVGLSIVEAMAYGLPVFTFERSEQTKQCVEYSYIVDGENGRIFTDIDAFTTMVTGLSRQDISRMGDNARHIVRERLTPKMMAQRAMSVVASFAKHS